MWWLEMRKGILGISRLSRLAAPFAAACLLAGCFQPLYGEHSAGAGPSIREQMRTVDVAQIAAANGTPESRLAVNVREAVVPNSGHWLMEESPAYTVALIRDYLKDPTAATPPH